MNSHDDIILNVEHLTVYYELEEETVKAVNDISFSLKRGETIGLVGETGAGKTTTALALMRLIPDPPGVIKSGKITVCGNDMLAIPKQKLETIRGKDISMIFQDPMTSLNPVYKVADQIAESLELHEKLSKEEAHQKALQMLETVGIAPERGEEYPHQFSGGMKQRVVIAIALACSPQLLIADEPTTALDVTIQAQVLDLIQNLKIKQGTSVIMITHNLGIVAETCDKVAVMYAGRIVEYGTLDEVFNHTRHPYTEGLFNSLPNINSRREDLKPIPGLMPDPTNLPEGCAFAPRCEYACDACRRVQPELRHFSPTHTAACVRYDEEGFHINREDKYV
ncbi:MAG: ABC transporter ATP-binding protein [Pyramidobacter sp.]|jgi:peptide/nickel transport system ATP-binding protein